MSNLAQEEADRIFSHKEHFNSHPEDRLDADEHFSSSEEKHHTSRTHLTNENDEYDDEDTLHTTTTATARNPAYHIPNRQFAANTGPKGVIADAQAFNLAKQNAFRRLFANNSNSITSSKPHQQNPAVVTKAETKKGKGSDPDANGSASDLDDNDDDDFMVKWRAARLRELTAAEQAGNTVRRQSPSMRTWRYVEDVDANGYLDAIEKVGDDVVVVVCIYDPESNASAAVEDALNPLAAKYPTTRFIKLHQDIAEFQQIVIPAILAYNCGELFATISDCCAEELEATLKRHNVLNRKYS